jgi:asparagine N-glycosylation enzyme membrane subunit Stt3
MTDLIVFEIAVNMLLLLPVFYGLGGIFISYTTHQINNDRPFIFASYTVAIVIGILFFMDPYGVCRKVITKIASKCQCFNFEE